MNVIIVEMFVFSCESHGHFPFPRHTGKVRTHGIGGGHKQRYRWVDFQRLRFEAGKEGQAFDEKVLEVRYDPCR